MRANVLLLTNYLLQGLPRNAALRKLNDLIKRARLAKVHAYVIAELRKQMPSMIGKEKKKKELIANLDKIYQQLQVQRHFARFLYIKTLNPART